MKIKHVPDIRVDKLRMLFASGGDVRSAQALIAWPHRTRKIQSAEIGCKDVRGRTS